MHDGQLSSTPRVAVVRNGVRKAIEATSCGER